MTGAERGGVRAGDVVQPVPVSAADAAPSAAGAVDPVRRGLELRDVVVRYGATTAVRGVDLRVAPGEVVCLLGPSGCGKSSLLRAAAGLEPLAAGSVRWDGSDLSGVPVHRRGFGLMFQDGQLFPHRDVAGNVAFGLRMAGMRPALRRERVAEALALVGLTGYDRRGVESLSGGEQQRVALARALAPRPRVLLLDEPLSSLDRGLRGHLAEEVRRVLLATGTTALFVTHDQDEAFAVGDRVAVMTDGVLRQVATPGELWSAPASREVADFLGYELFVPAAVAVTVFGSAAAAVLAGRPAGDDALLALGPRALTVREDAGHQNDGVRGPAGDDGPAWGSVLAVAARRGYCELTVEVDRLGPVRIMADGHPRWSVGQRVPLHLDAAAVAVLPAEAAVLPPGLSPASSATSQPRRAAGSPSPR